MLIAVALTLALAQAPQTTTVAQDLEQFEQRLAATWRSGDCAGWAAMLAPDCRHRVPCDQARTVAGVDHAEADREQRPRTRGVKR
jgi:hypothetical protein